MTETPKHRFFAADLSGDTIELAEEEARHARGVLRLTGGETVEVFDGAGVVVTGTFATARRPNPPLPRGAIQNSPRRKAGVRAVVDVVERRSVPRPEPTIELAFAVPKGNRLDWLLEKAAELGAARLAPVAFERSVSQPELSEHARQRWRGILVAACKQCGSAWLPELAPPVALADYLAGAHCGICLLGDAREGVSIAEALGGSTPRFRGGPFESGDVDADRGGTDKRCLLVRGGPVPRDGAGRSVATPPVAERRASAIRILVGPEGGLTDAERGAALAAGFVPVRIGWTVLRVETAAVALLAAVVAWAAPSHGT